MGGIVPWREVRGGAKEGVRKETKVVGCWESQGQVEDISEGQDSCPVVIIVSFERESLRRVSLWGSAAPRDQLCPRSPGFLRWLWFLAPSMLQSSRLAWCTW